MSEPWTPSLRVSSHINRDQVRRVDLKSWSGISFFTNVNHVSSLDLAICLLRKIFFCEQEHSLIEHSIHGSCFTKFNKKHSFLGQERNTTSYNFSKEEVHQPGSLSHLNYEKLSLAQKNAHFDDTHPVLHILKDGREGSCLLPSSCVA